MSFSKIITRLSLLFALCTAWGCRADRSARWARLPENRSEILKIAVQFPAGTYSTGSREPGCYPPERITLDAFLVWPVEITAAWWKAFRPDDVTDDVDLAQPATNLSYDDARAFCVWFSERYHLTARLPTRHEWQVAARAGAAGTPYPWGWGKPAGRCAFDAPDVSRAGTFRPNALGLYDLAGNVAEWVAAEDGESHAPVMGGSWAERDPKFVRISHRLVMQKTYRDRDVGFRIVIETP